MVRHAKQQQIKINAYNDSIQFHPAGAPVPLSVVFRISTIKRKKNGDVHVIVKTSLAERKPYVLCVAMGSQIKHRKKSTIINPTENLKTLEYHRGGK